LSSGVRFTYPLLIITTTMINEKKIMKKYFNETNERDGGYRIFTPKVEFKALVETFFRMNKEDLTIVNDSGKVVEMTRHSILTPEIFEELMQSKNNERNPKKKYYKRLTEAEKLERSGGRKSNYQLKYTEAQRKRNREKSLKRYHDNKALKNKGLA
jgi:hypothetical protein